MDCTQPVFQARNGSQRAIALHGSFTRGPGRLRNIGLDSSNRPLQLDVARRQIVGDARHTQSRLEIASTMFEVGERFQRGQVVRCGSQDLLQLPARIVLALERHQGSREGHPGGVVNRMNNESGTAHGDRLAKAARAPILFRKLRKNNRRRILSNPAS
jgi:hypothetical protein